MGGLLFISCGLRHVAGTAPSHSLDLWVDWIPPGLRGFDRWVCDAMSALSEFVRGVVDMRREERLRDWRQWIRKNHGSHFDRWLRPDIVLSSPLVGSGMMFELVLMDGQVS